VGAIRANDFPPQANGYGQADGDHASSRTDPDNAEHQTGIYGSEGSCRYGSDRTVQIARDIHEMILGDIVGATTESPR
jgi:hypothetical protein